jgi:hypothetical protein
MDIQRSLLKISTRSLVPLSKTITMKLYLCGSDGRKRMKCKAKIKLNVHVWGMKNVINVLDLSKNLTLVD